MKTRNRASNKVSSGLPRLSRRAAVRGEARGRRRVAGELSGRRGRRVGIARRRLIGRAGSENALDALYSISFK